jgi:hypothetical protein
MQAYGEVEVYIHVFLTSLVGEVSCMPLPLYLRGNNPRNPLDRRLGGHGEFLTLMGLELRPLGRPARKEGEKSINGFKRKRHKIRGEEKVAAPV